MLISYMLWTGTRLLSQLLQSFYLLPFSTSTTLLPSLSRHPRVCCFSLNIHNFAIFSLKTYSPNALQITMSDREEQRLVSKPPLLLQSEKQEMKRLAANF